MLKVSFIYKPLLSTYPLPSQITLTGQFFPQSYIYFLKDSPRLWKNIKTYIELPKNSKVLQMRCLWCLWHLESLAV